MEECEVGIDGAGVRTVRQEDWEKVKVEATSEVGGGALSVSGRRGKRPIGTVDRYCEAGLPPIRSAGC